jgi:glycerol-3-phosphate dehydrogenase
MGGGDARVGIGAHFMTVSFLTLECCFRLRFEMAGHVQDTLLRRMARKQVIQLRLGAPI